MEDGYQKSWEECTRYFGVDEERGLSQSQVEENLDKEVIKLFQDKLENGLSSLYRQLIGAVFLLVLLHLALAQPPLLVNTKVPGAFLPALLVAVLHGEKRPSPLW